MNRREVIASIGVLSALTACGQAPEPAVAHNPADWPWIVKHNEIEAIGTIIVKTEHRLLYLLISETDALVYPVGVGLAGRTWTGTEYITRKAEWPSWTPTPAMMSRNPELREYAGGMPGGPENPLGARALYLGDTYYRIHGTNDPLRVGRVVTNGCINMHNEHVIELYDLVGVGTKVVVS